MSTDIDPEGRFALHYAALRDDVAAARRALLSGESPDQLDAHGFTPLHLAAQEGSLAVADVLLQHGAAVDLENEFGNTPLFIAVFNSRGRGDLIYLLRAHGADPRHRNLAGQTPVGLAKLIGNYDVARFFADLPD